MLEKLSGHQVPIKYEDWRPGDQLVYVSDIRKAERDLGWQPQVSMAEGIERLWQWIHENPELFS